MNARELIAEARQVLCNAKWIEAEPTDDDMIAVFAAGWRAGSCEPVALEDIFVELANERSEAYRADQERMARNRALGDAYVAAKKGGA